MKACKHGKTFPKVVLGLAGPVEVHYCFHCMAIVHRTPVAAALQALAARDGLEAGPAKPCTCGDGQVLLGKRSYWCGCCFARSVARLLDEVPLHRLEAKGL